MGKPIAAKIEVEHGRSATPEPGNIESLLAMVCHGASGSVMIIPDLNLRIYAYNDQAPQHLTPNSPHSLWNTKRSCTAPITISPGSMAFDGSIH